MITHVYQVLDYTDFGRGRARGTYLTGAEAIARREVLIVKCSKYVQKYPDKYFPIVEVPLGDAK